MDGARIGSNGSRPAQSIVQRGALRARRNAVLLVFENVTRREQAYLLALASACDGARGGSCEQMFCAAARERATHRTGRSEQRTGTGRGSVNRSNR
eukprot:scaffold14290_cov125-Isochrysis_galbana.AAC.13